MDTLIGGYGQDPEITYLLDHREALRRHYDQPRRSPLGPAWGRFPGNGQPYRWRKTARDLNGPCAWPPTVRNHAGVDLIATSPSSGRHRAIASTLAIKHIAGRAGLRTRIASLETFIRSIFEDQRGERDSAAAPLDTMGIMVNYHNFTNPVTVLIPWSYTQDPAPNREDIVAVAGSYARDNNYDIKNALYPVSGTTRDWAYGELGIPGFRYRIAGAAIS